MLAAQTPAELSEIVAGIQATARATCADRQHRSLLIRTQSTVPWRPEPLPFQTVCLVLEKIAGSGIEMLFMKQILSRSCRTTKFNLSVLRSGLEFALSYPSSKRCLESMPMKSIIYMPMRGRG